MCKKCTKLRHYICVNCNMAYEHGVVMRFQNGKFLTVCQACYTASKLFKVPSEKPELENF